MGERAAARSQDQARLSCLPGGAGLPRRSWTSAEWASGLWPAGVPEKGALCISQWCFGTAGGLLGAGSVCGPSDSLRELGSCFPVAAAGRAQSDHGPRPRARWCPCSRPSEAWATCFIETGFSGSRAALTFVTRPKTNSHSPGTARATSARARESEGLATVSLRGKHRRWVNTVSRSRASSDSVTDIPVSFLQL